MNMETSTFMGHPVGYWMELERRSQELKAADLLEELVRLYGKVGFYEQRIREMAAMLPSLPQGDNETN